MNIIMRIYKKQNDMERRILCLLLTYFITFGSIFGQDLDYLEDMGTCVVPLFDIVISIG